MLKDYLDVAKFNPVVNEKELFSALTVATFPSDYQSLSEAKNFNDHIATVVDQLFSIQDPLLKIAIFCFVNQKKLSLSEDRIYNLKASMKNISDSQVGI